jgi:hypothetical protein
MENSASLNVRDRKVLARSLDTKPNPADSMDQWVVLRSIDLATDSSNVNVDDVGRGIEIVVPHVLQQHRPRDNLALIANKVLEQLEFTWQQVDLLTITARRS